MNDSPINTCVDLEELVGELAEQFVEELKNGEHPDVEQYARNYPKVADALRQILPALRVIGAAPIQNSGAEPETSRQLGHDLGDFRLVREIGRGGMGVVYEAEQLSLGRRMALKVLPFAAMLDKQQQRRFKNEARAAATLNHPNIVAVHSVGEERGVYYYAMQLVEGQSLAEVIATRRQSAGLSACELGPSNNVSTVDQRSSAEAQSADSLVGNPAAAVDTRPVAALSTTPEFDTDEYFRTVAKLGVQAARGLDHAHQSGIVHRDVKPGNLLIDAEGRLFVADFGLARIETDAGMTMTGDLVGTMRYMSPEQTLAKRVVVDHRTDIYSLGVTLYELLALRPAYPQQEQRELLRHIALEDLPRLRRLSRHIPVELETIVAKAVEKNPHDRYETMKELADDLERYLDDKPIHAKSPSPMQVGKKWAKRHSKGVKFTIAALLLAICSGFAGVAWQSKTRLEVLEECLTLLTEIGMNHVNNGKYHEGEERLEEALRLALEGLPNSNELLPKIRYGLGRSKYELLDKEGARQILEPLRRKRISQGSANSVELVWAKYYLAEIDRENGDHESALFLLEEAERSLALLGGTDLVLPVLLHAAFADVLSQVGQDQRAIEFALKTMSAAMELGRWHRRTRELTKLGFTTLHNVHDRAGRKTQFLEELNRIRDEVSARHGQPWGTRYVGWGLLISDVLPERRRDYMFDSFRSRIREAGDMRRFLKPLLDHYEDYYEHDGPSLPSDPQYAGLKYDRTKAVAFLPTLHFDGKGPWTLEAYATPALHTDVGPQMLVSTMNYGGIAICLMNGHWTMWLKDGQKSENEFDSNYKIAKSTKPVEYGRRQHIAAVWDGDEIRLYVDGERQETCLVDSQGVREYLVATSFIIGAEVAGDGSFPAHKNLIFNGVIEAVRISKAAVYRGDEFTPCEELGRHEGTIGLYDFRYAVTDPTPGDQDDCFFVLDRSGYRNHAWVANAKQIQAVETDETGVD